MLQKFDERNRDLIVNVGGRLSHRDEAGVSPFDSVVQGGDAVWEGLRLTNGRIFALEEHLARLRRSAHALGFAVGARRRGDHRGDQAHAGRQLDDDRGAHPADAHPRGQAHLGHGPPAERLRADADRAGRVQGPGLRPVRDPADHVERAAARAGLARPQDPPQQPADLDPGQDRGERGGRRRRGHARQPRLHRRDQRDAPVHGAAGEAAVHAGDADHGRLPGGRSPGRPCCSWLPLPGSAAPKATTR